MTGPEHVYEDGWANSAAAWYSQADETDLGSLEPEKLRELLTAGIAHMRHLLEIVESAEFYEADVEREGTHLTFDGTAMVVRGTDLLTLIARRAAAASVLADYRAATAATPSPARGFEWMLRLAAALESLLGSPVAQGLDEDERQVRTYTHPDVFTAGVAEGWAEAETDPARIDWPPRQAAAAIPFQVADGRPVNPCARTSVRHGRNELGRWGENLMADAIVTVTCRMQRYLLMVERADGGGWAVPGGSVEPGETGVQAAIRELQEETGLAVVPVVAQDAAPLYVPDPRASDEAWAVTIPLVVDLGCQDDGLPFVRSGEDARRADWLPSSDYDQLTAALSQRHGGQVFAAHADMLRQFLSASNARRDGDL